MTPVCSILFTASTTLFSRLRYSHFFSLVPWARIWRLVFISHPVGWTFFGSTWLGLPAGTLSRSCGKFSRMMLTTSWGEISPAIRRMRWLDAALLVKESTWACATSRTSTCDRTYKYYLVTCLNNTHEMIKWKSHTLDILVCSINETRNCKVIGLIDRFFAINIMNHRTSDDIRTNNSKIKCWLLFLHKSPGC